MLAKRSGPHIQIPGLASAQSASTWVFATGLPFALLGAWAAWRLTAPVRARRARESA